ncbi:pesticin C-terminus-like muramidase [Dickeya chrysanthemi]|nr:pesticin C-terminus-like muramidase [Dickeya chrysanthemi]
MAAPLSRLAGTVPGLLSSASTSLAQAAKGKAVESKPVSTESQASPIDVKPVEVDVKVNSIASTSSSDSLTPTAAAALSNNATASTPKPIATVTWNPATTISSLRRKAGDTSTKYCARAVVDAIRAGGTRIEGANAKDLGPKLIAAGFKAVFSMSRPSTEYDRSKLLPGDVVVLEGFTKDERKGIKKDHPFGHAAMYDGSKWISDFNQPGFYPGSDYRAARPGYTIYRMVATQAQIDAINASQNTEPASNTAVSTPPATVTQATRSSTSAPTSRPTAQTPRASVTVARPAQQTVSPSVPVSHTEPNNSQPTASIRVTSQPEHTTENPTVTQGTNNQSLTVLKGKVTYDAEGREERGKYFSRQIHFPESKNSGVTIGRGYDMGERTKEQVLNDLIAAGIPASQASRISAAAGKKGESARKFVNDNKDIGEITTEQQIKLFNNIYPTYESKAQRLYKENTRGMSNVTKWENLNPAIKDILVDIAYQGFQGVLAMPAASQNNIDQFITFLKNNEDYKKYEEGRHRVAYLQKEKNRTSGNQSQ